MVVLTLRMLLIGMSVKVPVGAAGAGANAGAAGAACRGRDLICITYNNRNRGTEHYGRILINKLIILIICQNRYITVLQQLNVSFKRKMGMTDRDLLIRLSVLHRY